MTISAEDRIIEIIKKSGVDLAVTVPCKFFSGLLEKMEKDGSVKVVWPAREEEGLGIASGYYLGGKKGIMVIQNSGLGNMVNALLSLNRYYEIPVFIMVSHRGGPLEKVEAQNPMGEITPALLDTAGIKYAVMEKPGDLAVLEEALGRFVRNNESAVMLIKQSFWSNA